MRKKKAPYVKWWGATKLRGMLSVSRTASLIHFLALGNSFMDLVVCCNGLRLYQFVGPGFIPPNYCLLPYGSRPALQQHPKEEHVMYLQPVDRSIGSSRLQPKLEPRISYI